MNKRIKKKQEAVRWRKEYKSIKKARQRYSNIYWRFKWHSRHLPPFREWKNTIIFREKVKNIFGLPSALMPNAIANAVKKFYKFGGNV